MVWLGYELTVLFSLVAIFAFQFAVYIKINKIERIVKFIDKIRKEEESEEDDKIE